VKPAVWLVENLDVIPSGGMVLDVACGAGRHALFLATLGFRVHAVDRDVTALVAAGRVGQVGQAGEITAERVDLESGLSTVGNGFYDAVIVFNYLHRPLMPAIVNAVRPGGGVLIYETFTIGQAQRGRPRNPDFLLRDGELPALVVPLRVLRAREGDYEGRLVASIVAVRD
jgi:SAM-dependent methyltransferase